MEKREERRDRSYRYGERARDTHLRVVHGLSSGFDEAGGGALDCVCERSVWYFAKKKSLGCRCRKHARNASPKIAASLCHGGGARGLHPAVVERIDGKRLSAAWLKLLFSGVDGVDVEL